MSRLRTSIAASARRLGRGWRSLPAAVRAVLVVAAAAALLVAGIAMLVLPGPGLLAIALAIGLLATEFTWARRLVERGRARLGNRGRRTPPRS
jgi:hypothetical protein